MAGEPDRKCFDPGALVIGAWLAVVGVVALTLGQDGFAGALPWIGPVTLVVVGIGLAVPARVRGGGASADRDPSSP